MKILDVLDMLKTKTDAKHPMTASDIVDELSKRNIKAERKSIYSYIKELTDSGYDIVSLSRQKGWYMNADLELYEYKIIEDAINSLDFISDKRSEEFIDKLTDNVFIKEELARSMVVSPYKTDDNSIVYNINKLTEAISRNEEITFKYTDVNFSGRKQRKKQYTRIPKALVMFNQRYYCIVYSELHSSYGHFRVDKMNDIVSVACDKIIPALELEKYIAEKFNMNTGIKENIEIEFSNAEENIVFDRFRQNAMLIKQDDKTFVINIDTVISEDLIGWITSFGNKAKVLKPQSLINEIIKINKEVLKQYE